MTLTVEHFLNPLDSQGFPQVGNSGKIKVSPMLTEFLKPDSLRAAGEAIKSILISDSDKAIGGIQSLTSHLSSLFSKGLDLKHLFGDVPFNALDSLKSVSSFLDQSEITELQTRRRVVTHAFGHLMELIGAKDSFALFAGASESVLSIFDIIDGQKSTGDVLESCLKKLLQPDGGKGVANGILEAAKSGRWLEWAKMPAALKPGALHEWINDSGKYLNNGADDDLRRLERQYRCRIVGSVDHYLRSQIQIQSQFPTSAPSSKPSPQLFADLIEVLIGETVRFILTPSFAVLSSRTGEPRSLKTIFALSIAEQVKSSIRSQMGTLFRGAWEYSVHSDALAELISSFVGSLFSSILEGVVTQVLGKIGIESRYSTSTSTGTVFKSMDRVTWKDSTGTKEMGVEYAVLKRDGQPMTIPSGTLYDIIADFVAYLDMCYQEFSQLDRFISIPTPQGGNIRIDSATRSGRKLIVTCSVNVASGLFANTNSVPVVRAYIGNLAMLMRPESNNPPTYKLEYSLPMDIISPSTLTLLTSAGKRVSGQII